MRSFKKRKIQLKWRKVRFDEIIAKGEYILFFDYSGEWKLAVFCGPDTCEGQAELDPPVGINIITPLKASLVPTKFYTYPNRWGAIRKDDT